MKFGEKVRELRKKCGMTQAELAKKAGLGLKTITNYESGSTYPQNREVYASENEEFIAMAQREYGYRGRKGAEKLVEELTGLFAGGEMAEEDMDEMMLAIQEAYVIAKKNNKKYTPKKYRRSTGGGE